MNLLEDMSITCRSHELQNWVTIGNSKPVTSLYSADLIEQATLKILPTFGQKFAFLYVFQVGYDPEIDSYPSWLMAQPYSHMLPSVRPPGAPIGPIKDDLRSQFGKHSLHVISYLQ
jgi:hypothetical protein